MSNLIRTKLNRKINRKLDSELSLVEEEDSPSRGLLQVRYGSGHVLPKKPPLPTENHKNNLRE